MFFPASFSVLDCVCYSSSIMRCAFFLFSAGVILFCLCAAQPAGAQKFQPKSIQFKGDPEYSDQELLAASGLKKGAVLNYAEMKDHSQKLMDTGAFDTLSFKFDGQDLIYTLVPSEVLFPVRLENLPLTPDPEFSAALHERFPLYHGKVPAEGGLVDGVRAALEEMLAAKGIHATILAAPFTDQKLHKVTAVSFTITAPPVRVGEIHLEGVSPAMQEKVKRAIEHQSGAAFDTENSAGNVERVLATAYTDEGYAAVKIHAVREGDAVVSAEAIQIPFAVSVEEGRQYKLGSIHLQPGSLVTQAEIDKAAGLGSGPAKGAALRGTWGLINSRYKSKGYLDCKVTPHAEADEAGGVVNYTVEVTPGPVYHLAFVKFENVSDELRSHLMRIWQMLPGDVFDESYVAQFIYRAQKEDPVLMRSLAGVKLSYNVLANPQTHEVNCIIHFSKTQTTP